VPYCLVTVPTPGKTALLYPVRFPDSLPDFRSLNFSLHLTSQGTVVYMSPEQFWAADSNSVPVSTADWNARAPQFHDIMAMHRLSVVPAVSKAFFKASADPSTFASDMDVRYGTCGPTARSLRSIFFSSVEALRIFGFYRGGDFGSVPHAFGDLSAALCGFNSICEHFNGRRPDFLTGHSYKMLLRSRALAANLCEQLGFGGSLFDAIKAFQSAVGRDATGVCDSGTLDELWSEAVGHSLHMDRILEESGFAPTVWPVEPGLTFIEKVSDDPGSEMFRAQLNEMVCALPDFGLCKLVLERRVKRAIGGCAARCVCLNQRIEAVEKRTAAARDSLERVAATAAECADVLDQTKGTFEAVIRDHIAAQAQFEDMKLQIAFRRRWNDLMTIFGILILVVFCLKVFHISPFSA
jgi:hypothetical protein